MKYNDSYCDIRVPGEYVNLQHTEIRSVFLLRNEYLYSAGMHQVDQSDSQDIYNFTKDFISLVYQKSIMV